LDKCRLIGDNLFAGNWTQTAAATKYIEEKREGWEKIQQPVGEYCEVIVKVNPDKKTALLAVFGEDRVFVREFRCTVGKIGCGGGGVIYRWP